MPSKNNVIPNGHFHKDWQGLVKTWFDQAARKKRRREARNSKATAVFPRPVSGAIRPVVHPPTLRYNLKARLGRGFTLEEVKGAGINRREALSLGIAVDHRRRNKSDKSYGTNVQRLKEYKSKLVLFPRKDPKKPKKGEASIEEQQKAAQQGTVLPIRQRQAKLQVLKLSEVDTKQSAYATLRKARSDARLVGIRKKRAETKANEAVALAAKGSKGKE